MKKILFFLTLAGIIFAQSKKDVKLIIYNQNFAVCNEIRIIELKEGKNEVIFTDIPKFIEPSSIQVLPLSLGKFSVIEQSFNYDVYTSDKLFSKNIGENVNIITKDGQLYTGTLLFYEQGNVGIETKDKIVVINKENLKEVSMAKTGIFIYKPQLKFIVQSDKKDIYRVLLKYITLNINWKADYIGEYDEEKNNLNLVGYITVDNKTGIDYENVDLELIAGEVRKLVEYDARKMAEVGVAALRGAEMEIPSFEETPIFEYHRYTFIGKTDIKDEEVKQINFITRNNINIEKKYVYDGAITRYYHYDNWRNLKFNEKVEVIIEFKNEKEVLPAGKMKIFKNEKDGTIFIGENRINHTPIGEKIKLSLGNAFDIKGERKVLNHERISQQVYKDTYEIKIKNYKKEDIVVDVIEHLYSNWEIIEKTHDYEKVDAFTIKFPLKVKGNSEETVKYTVITRF
ncbi:MAG: hypothetical protein NC827_03015 [Candidatus Omnitrophica bacterium]|nr:hypothetical protein [Candidatus Omnitrophota bacterium]MCM8802263.1 hypothetical protein [Candidatus Omnitrophota bacterium]